MTLTIQDWIALTRCVNMAKSACDQGFYPAEEYKEVLATARKCIDAAELVPTPGWKPGPAIQSLNQATERADARIAGVNPNSGVVQPYPKGRW